MKETTAVLLDTSRADLPVMPRLAAKAARDLARSLKSMQDALRAVEAWFGHNGDPFAAIDGPAFADAVSAHRDVYDAAAPNLTNADLVARIASDIAALSSRLARAERGGAE
jgi:hypothetical protein